MEKVTAVLITWKRQKNIPQIIESLLKYDFINEIILYDNSKQENIINYARYVGAQKAQNNWIYVQDDDHIVRNIDEIYEEFSRHPNVLTHAGNVSYENDIPNNIHNQKQMALVGWGAMFDKRWINILEKYTNEYGEDYCFHRETDRIFSILLGKHHAFVRGDIQVLEGATTPEALSQQANHLEYKKLAIERALAL